MPEPPRMDPDFDKTSPFVLGDDSDRRPLSAPDQPISIPRDWAGHICVALAGCLNRSEDAMDLDAVERIGVELLELYPDLAEEVPYVRVLKRGFINRKRKR